MQSKHIGIQTEHCANTMESLHQQGFSVIPLQGKRPKYSIKWKQYQYKLADKKTITEWLSQTVYSYGIICGRVSGGIVVLDFDCVKYYQQFKQSFHILSKTYTVKTKRGYHVYLKSDFPIPTRHFERCDIQGDGGYVVGSESSVNGHIYKVYQSDNIQTMDYKSYREILEWLSPLPKQLELFHKIASKSDNPHDLIDEYKKHYLKHGRNNALFQVACLAKQQGLEIQGAIDQLATVHADTKPTYKHHKETTAQRLKEAISTIHSAYKKTGKQTFRQSEDVLANSVREELLKRQGSASGARLLDLLVMTEQQGKWLTTRQIITIGQSISLGRKSIFRLLIGDLSKVNGKRIFKQISYQDHISSYVSQGDKRIPNSTVGRPTQFMYRVPTQNELCMLLRVKVSMADELKKEDLYSSIAYRRALHRELIRRLSPIIKVTWHAERLNVNKRTIFRYNRQLNVIATPTIQKQPLKHAMIANFAEDGFTPGMWLESKEGKRYPAIQTLANIFLIKNKCSIFVCKQLPSRYTLPDQPNLSDNGVCLPIHLKSRSQLLTYSNIHEVLPPDWATKKYDIGGYLAVYNGYEWTFRPPLRAIAYPLVKHYEEGLVYFIRPLKT